MRLPGWSLMLLVAFAPSLVVGAEFGPGTRDEERKDEERRDEAPAPKAAVPAQAVSSPAPQERKQLEQRRSTTDFVPATQSLSLDLGGAVNTMGGYAYPKIGLKNAADDGFYPHGLGGGFKLHWDFSAQDLDWRIGLDGTLPAFAALEATVGVRKDLSPWQNPRLIVRGAGGIEMMLGGANDRIFMLPVFVGRGETFLEVTVVPNVLSLGGGVELALRYGIPLGVGVDFGAFVRSEVWF